MRTKSTTRPKRPGDGADARIVASAQSSRFHSESTGVNGLKEIDVKDLTISIGGREIIEDAHLKINAGSHVVLTGRNGTGKSTLLKALAEQKIPGISSDLEVLLLGQTKTEVIEPDARPDGTTRPSGTVLDYVVSSNKKAMQALKEQTMLSEALENSEDSTPTIRAIRTIKCTRLAAELEVLRLAATHQSGTRGSEARKAVTAAEARLEAASTRLEESEAVNAFDIDEAEFNEAVEMLEEVNGVLDGMNIQEAENRATTILLGLGFPLGVLHRSFGSLSGGWQTRCELACALTQDCDVLCLDEPTNFLSLDGIMWLESYITSRQVESTIIVVTHDRDFADAIAEELLVLRTLPPKTLELFKGNLSNYESERMKKIRYMTTMKEAESKTVSRSEVSIASNIAAAKRTGDDKRLKQASSRKKKLTERTGLEVGQNGGRFKLSRDRPGFQNSLRAEIEIPDADPPVLLNLPANPTSLRIRGPLVSLEAVFFHYDEAPGQLLNGISLVIQPGQRLALVGLNGVGKSSLVNILSRSASPTSGEVIYHPQARMKIYNQHAVTIIQNEGREIPSMTALSYLIQKSSNQLSENEARSVLGDLGLHGRLVSDLSLTALSGGQKVRLALAECIWDSPHLLILDEVSSHLDADTILALVQAFETWTGAILVVSHDRAFVRGIVEREKIGYLDDVEGAERADDHEPGQVLRLYDGRLQHLEGGMSEYEALLLP